MAANQHEFVAELTRQLDDMSSIEVYGLPGESAEPETLNTCRLGMAELSDFDQLPNYEQFLDTYNRPPHAFILLGNTALALVRSDFIPRAEDGQLGQHLVAYNVDGPAEVTGIPGDYEYIINLDRNWLAANAINDPAIEREHAALAQFDNFWLVHDKGTERGTRVAVEAYTQSRWPAKTDEADTEIIVTGWVPDTVPNFGGLGPSIYQSATFPAHPSPKHRLGQPRRDNK